MEKSDKSMYADELKDCLNKMKYHGKFLTKKEKMSVVLVVYGRLRKEIANAAVQQNTAKSK